MDVSYLLFPFTASFNLNTEKNWGLVLMPLAVFEMAAAMFFTYSDYR